MKALVTGASGFLGSCIVEKLKAQGFGVRVFVRQSGSAPVGADEVIEGDLRDAAALSRALDGIETVIHAGARVATTGPWDEFQATNVQATDDVIRLAVEKGASRIVHVSSLSVYAVEEDGTVVTEEGPFDQASDERGSYARSKLAADLVAQDWIKRGAPVTIVRPGLLYGPGRRPPLGRRVIALGPLRVVLARREYVLPLAYVENIAEGIVLAAMHPAAVGRAYSMVDHPVRQGDYLKTFLRVSGASWKAFYAPVGAMITAAGVVESAFKAVGRRSPVTRHQVERTVRSAMFSQDRIRQEIRWQPRIGLEDALRRTIVAARSIRPAQPAQPTTTP